jgi:hypothetical protein
MGTSARRLTVDLGHALESRLEAAVRSDQTTKSVFVRRAINRLLGEVESGQAPQPVVPSRDEAVVDVRLRVPRTAMRRLSSAAVAAGMTQSAFISAGIVEFSERCDPTDPTATLTPGPQAAGSLRQALVASNATLSSIGRTLNRAVSANGPHAGHIPTTDLGTLTATVAQVAEHIELVATLLQAIRAPQSPR